jgi:hypothetical protein
VDASPAPVEGCSIVVDDGVGAVEIGGTAGCSTAGAEPIPLTAGCPLAAELAAR